MSVRRIGICSWIKSVIQYVPETGGKASLVQEERVALAWSRARLTAVSKIFMSIICVWAVRYAPGSCC